MNQGKWLVLVGALALVGCSSNQAPPSTPTPSRCAGQMIAIVTNRTESSIDVFGGPSYQNLGSVSPNSVQEIPMGRGDTYVSFGGGRGHDVRAVYATIECRK
ncbi:MAG: hypothetical protein HOP28_06405 [Gemmatimonadales bacterium]|nr:hypothetical protein [Gemmatimonadales bacterium]